MNVPDILSEIAERVQSNASVKAVYGDPVESGGKTIIPVAKVRYGFGGGGGSGETPAPGDDKGEEASSGNPTKMIGSGGGGGGGVSVTPAGYIEITAHETRYVSFEERQRLITAGLAALFLGGFLLWRRYR